MSVLAKTDLVNFVNLYTSNAPAITPPTSVNYGKEITADQIDSDT